MVIQMNNPKNFRVFWKIIVRVQSGDIRVEKEVSLWYISDSNYSYSKASREKIAIGYRLISRTFKLPFTPKSLSNDTPVPLKVISPYVAYLTDGQSSDGVYSSDEREEPFIQFDDSYLHVEDPGLKSNLETILKKDLTGRLGSTSKAVEFIESIVGSEDSSPTILNGVGDDESESHAQFVRGSKGEIVYRGENVRIDVDCNLDERPNEVHPIFFYFQNPQSSPSHAVVLEEVCGPFQEAVVSQSSNKFKLTARHINWEISGRGFKTSDFFLQGDHLISVSHDKDRDPNADKVYNPRFEFLVDAFPLKVPPEDYYNDRYQPHDPDPNSVGEPDQKSEDDNQDNQNPPKFNAKAKEGYEFTIEKTPFFIGYNPNSNTADREIALKGKIRRIDFDPNSTCHECIT